MLAQITLVGRVGKDGKVGFTKEGKPWAMIDIAVQFGYGEGKRTEWVSCSFWDKNAENAGKMLVTGRPVVITASEFEMRTWNDAQGNAKAKLRVRVDKFRVTDPQPTDTPEGDVSF